MNDFGCVAVVLFFVVLSILVVSKKNLSSFLVFINKTGRGKSHYLTYILQQWSVYVLLSFFSSLLSNIFAFLWRVCIWRKLICVYGREYHWPPCLTVHLCCCIFEKCVVFALLVLSYISNSFECKNWFFRSSPMWFFTVRISLFFNSSLFLLFLDSKYLLTKAEDERKWRKESNEEENVVLSVWIILFFYLYSFFKGSTCEFISFCFLLLHPEKSKGTTSDRVSQNKGKDKIERCVFLFFSLSLLSTSDSNFFLKKKKNPCFLT